MQHEQSWAPPPATGPPPPPWPPSPARPPPQAYPPRPAHERFHPYTPHAAPPGTFVHSSRTLIPSSTWGPALPAVGAQPFVTGALAMQGRPSVPLHMLAERAAVFEHALQPAGQAAQALVFDCGRGCRGQRQRPRRQNIALNQQIAKVESTLELCILMEQNAAEFDHVNVVTAFRKLLQAPRAGMPRGVVEHSLKRWNSGRCRQCKTLGRGRLPTRYT